MANRNTKQKRHRRFGPPPGASPAEVTIWILKTLDAMTPASRAAFEEEVRKFKVDLLRIMIDPVARAQLCPGEDDGLAVYDNL